MSGATKLPDQPDEKTAFADRVTFGIAMTKSEVISLFLGQFPESSETAVLRAFMNLSNAPENATITFERNEDNRAGDAVIGRIRKPDGTMLSGYILAHARTGQPLSIAG